jgi:hypothetical protein
VTPGGATVGNFYIFAGFGGKLEDKQLIEKKKYAMDRFML